MPTADSRTAWRERFEALCARRTAAANAAILAPITTLVDRSPAFDVASAGNDWTRAVFDGPFLFTPASGGLPAFHLVFVQSRDGNTGASNPASLGAGGTDLHLIYEGLSRVASHAVIAGAGTVGEKSLYTVWRRELVQLRESLGLPRHPAQVILMRRALLDPDRILLFNVPEVPVYILTSGRAWRSLGSALAERPWVSVIEADNPGTLLHQAARLRSAGVEHVSAIGGRRAATELVDAGLVLDVYLTTSPKRAGEPGTPWYVGERRPRLDLVLKKSWPGDGGDVTFEHFSASRSSP